MNELLDKLKFPQKSIYNEIEKWYNETEQQKIQVHTIRRCILARLERYIINDKFEFLSLEENVNEESISLISLFPWFDENKYFEYADMLIDKKTYTSQFEHVFNAIIVHYLLKDDLKIAQRFMHRVFDRAIPEEYKHRTFDIFIPDLNTCAYNTIYVGKNMLLAKYLLDHQGIKPRSYLKNRIVGNLIDIRDGDIVDIDRNTLKQINMFLSKLNKNKLNHRMQYRDSQNGISITSSEDTMIQALESSEYIFERTVEYLDDLWNTKTSEMVKKCYEKYPERFMNIIKNYVSYNKKQSVVKYRARLIANINNNAKYLNISENVLPYVSDDFMAQYLQFII